ncbi:MAG: glycogen synthase GlgA [Mariprofundaceae bacterium]
MHIIFVASEATPLAKTGGLADVVGSLPHALKECGHNVRVILPYYRKQIAASGVQVKPLRQNVAMFLDGLPRIIPLHEARVAGLRFVLVEQDDLFDREGIYGPAGGEYADNLLRYTLLCRTALEAACLSGEPVDIFHCHDWQTGLLPLLLDTQYRHRPEITATRCIFTIHNLAYQGVFSADWLGRLGLPASAFHPGCMEFYGQVNCLKAGIASADQITTVSPSYAEEILTTEYGCNLDGFLQDHAHKLNGIVNGLDVDSWNPATDKMIASQFGPGNIKGKRNCKMSLQHELGLKNDEKAPLLAMVSRLAEQKGVDLVVDNLLSWIGSGYQLAILGSGDPYFERRMLELATEHPNQMAFFAGFNEKLARSIYAGADMFLMPSRFEPCGLSQLIAMRYGCIPVVRETGGLKDTVVDYGQFPDKATGFSFIEDTALSFHKAVQSAIEVFRKPKTWARIRTRAMRRDSSWNKSAKLYASTYKKGL